MSNDACHHYYHNHFFILLFLLLFTFRHSKKAFVITWINSSTVMLQLVIKNVKNCVSGQPFFSAIMLRCTIL